MQKMIVQMAHGGLALAVVRAARAAKGIEGYPAAADLEFD